MLTIEVRHLGGTLRTVEVKDAIHGANARCLILQWGIAGEYCLDVNSNFLVMMKGGKVTKRLQWRAVDQQQAIEVWKRLKGTRT